jgi:glutathione S-transferase
MATLEPPVLKIFLNLRMLPEEQRSPQAVEEGKKQFAEVARVLTQALGGKSYLLGEQFSAADVVIGSTLAWASALGLLEGHDELQKYVQRVTERPAYKRARAD